MSEKQTKFSDLIFNLAMIQAEIHSSLSTRYFNKQAVIKLANSKPLMNLEFDLVDLFLICAITQSNVLISGSSGSGKTYLAELIATGIFGAKNYTRKNITMDMNEQDFMDIDFGAIKEGKKLKEAMIADNLFSQPCLIIDEANRAPPIIQNRLMQILENNVDLKSKTVKAGILLKENQYYHWNILTLNYGDEYFGTSQVDRALKDRIIIDIPIDNFPPTLDDQIQMIRSFTPESVEQIPDADKRLFQIYSNLKKIPLSVDAEALILYMSFTSNCIKSKTGSKYGLNFSPQFCKEQDCPYARNPPLSTICPYIYAPSNRVLRRLVNVAKGFALLKHAKITDYLLKYKNEKEAMQYAISQESLEVTQNDVMQIAPFVLHSKISMNREWVIQKFNGNTFLACQEFLRIVNARLDYFMKNLLMGIIKEKQGQELSEKDIGMRKKAIRDDFHFTGMVKYVKEFLN